MSVSASHFIPPFSSHLGIHYVCSLHLCPPLKKITLCINLPKIWKIHTHTPPYSCLFCLTIVQACWITALFIPFIRSLTEQTLGAFCRMVAGVRKHHGYWGRDTKTKGGGPLPAFRKQGLEKRVPLGKGLYPVAQARFPVCTCLSLAAAISSPCVPSPPSSPFVQRHGEQSPPSLEPHRTRTLWKLF